MIENTTHAALLFLVLGGGMLFWVLAVTSILHQPSATGMERVLWVILAILFPFLGPLIWFVWARPRYLRLG